MMKYEDDNIIIEYSKNEEIYIKNIIKTINNKINELMNFFKITKLENKIKVVIWASLEEYKNNVMPFLIESNKEYKEWMIADTYDGNINMLSIEIVKELKDKENYDKGRFLNIVNHELTHICQDSSKLSDNNTFIWEVLATNLGEADKYNGLIKIDASREELEENFNNVNNNYGAAYTFGKYLFNNYTKEEIYHMLESKEVYKNNMPAIFEKAKEWSKRYINNDIM